MTVEYILLMFAVFFIGLKFFASAPQDAFKKSAPVLALRVEKHLITGNGFEPSPNQKNAWDPEP